MNRSLVRSLTAVVVGALAVVAAAAADGTPPEVSLSAPAPSSVVRGTVNLSATASDDVGVVGVQFLLDGQELGAEDVTPPYATAWNSSLASPGVHALAARARDAAGNLGASASVSVTADNQAPTGTATINAGAAATNTRAVTLTLSASDALSTVTQMRFSNTGTSYSSPVVYATTKAWTLPAGAGKHQVYAQFKDAVGNWSEPAVDVILFDPTPPLISAVEYVNRGPFSATIAWATDEPATSRVEYGTTAAFGSSSPLDPALVTGHAVGLAGLAMQTTYHYRVRSQDAAGNERVSARKTFKTPFVDLVSPSVPTGLVANPASSTSVSLSWTPSTDNVGVTGYAVFRDGASVGSPAAAAFVDQGLAPATTYSYAVKARDAAGRTSALSDAVTATTPALVITGVGASEVTSNSAAVAWTTDRPSSSQVEYGPTTSYGAATPVDAALVSAHARTLSGLNPNTTYHYRVRSADGDGREAVSGDFTFTTLPGSATGSFQDEVLVSGLTLPVALEFLPNGDLLVLELGGVIRRVDPETWQVDPTPFLVLPNVGTANGQQGLMDMALDPGFATNRYYYVFYTLGSPNRDRVSRFTANASLTSTVAGSEFVLYQDPEDANAEHHGGSLNFGNDGKLYVTTGEHFIPSRSQSLTNPRGKILRFNPDGSVPTDNPFHDGPGPNVDAIWALGLRNPFRASYDVPTGRLYIGDVGGNVYSTAQEEVHVGLAGANYGWPNCEGFSCGADPTYTNPWYAYPHLGRDGSITGGFVYRGTQFPAEYQGNYFYADYSQNWIKRLALDTAGTVTAALNFQPADGAPDGPYGDIVFLCEGPDGALYYVDLGYSDDTGQTTISRIRRIRFAESNPPPNVAASASPTDGLAPLTVVFSSEGTSDPEGDTLTYLWTFGDGATSTEANPTHVYTANGPYAARLAVSDAENTALSDPIAINVGVKPVPTVLTPDEGMLFRAGDTIFYSGEATDAEDGTLPASAFTWNVDFLHEGHVHPGLPQTGVKVGTYTVPTSGHDFNGNTRYRITLTVTDSDGLRGSQSIIVYPEKVTLTLASVPSGLRLSLDDIPHATPFAYDTLIGFSHTLEAPNQTQGANLYNFTAWSDGGAQQHAIVVPDADGTYEATFDESPIPLPSGLVAGYRFAEGTGATTADLSGNGLDGTLVNGPTWTTGRYGNGLAFGGDDYVDVGNPAALQLTGSMTLTAWIKIAAHPWDDAAIVAKLASGGWQLKTSADTGVRTAAIQLRSPTGEDVQRNSATVLALDTWYHLAGVYDAAARTLSIYVNGVKDDGVLVGTVPASQVNSPENVNIAQRVGFPGTFNFLGVLDEVHVFNRALTAAEVQVDMNTSR